MKFLPRKMGTFMCSAAKLIEFKNENRKNNYIFYNTIYAIHYKYPIHKIQFITCFSLRKMI